MSAQLPQPILEQAAHWFAVLQDEAVSATDQQLWADWLAADPAHQQAWQRVLAISAQFAAPRAMDSNSRQAVHLTLRDSARSMAVRRRTLKTLGLLALGSSTAWLSSLTPAGRHTLAALGWDWHSDYNTGKGQTRELRLADGSRLWLAPQTALDLSTHGGHGLLRLRQGEILFDSAPATTTTTASPAPQRLSWRVQTEQAELQPLGTRFSVRSDASSGLLSVFAGAVRITLHQAPEAGHTVAAGQQAAFTAHTVDALQTVQQARQAWTKGVLLADDMPLSLWTAELAPFHPGLLSCDPAIAQLRVSGGFPLHDSERALRLLVQAMPVRVRHPLPWLTRLEGLPGA